VATIRALKMHGGPEKTELSKPDAKSLEKGFSNLRAHIQNIKKFGVPSVVAVNRFSTDTDEEIAILKKLCEESGSEAVLCEAWEKGGEGASALAKAVSDICDKNDSSFRPLYEDSLSLDKKIEKIATEIYHASSVEFQASSFKKLKEFESQGYGNIPVCIAKTQNSISHDPKLVGAPEGYVFPVKDVQLYAGAGFVVVFAGDIMTMPGLPKMPSALNIDVDDDGIVSGLF